MMHDDFAPVRADCRSALYADHPAQLPGTDLKQFIGYAKTNQSKLQYGSGGQGSGTHITCLLLNTAIGIEVTHVPYRSTSAGDAGSAGRPHRLSLRSGADVLAGHPGKNRQGDGCAEPRARDGVAGRAQRA